jgi:hypothetical protein
LHDDLLSGIAIGIVALPGPQHLQPAKDSQEGHQVGPDEIRDGQSEEQDDD